MIGVGGREAVREQVGEGVRGKVKSRETDLSSL